MAYMFKASKTVLNKLAQSISSISYSKLNCVVCPLVTTHKLPFVASTSRFMKPSDLVFANMWTSHVISFIGAQYVILHVDDYTKFMWVYFVTPKSQVKLALECFKALVQR